MPKNSRLDQLLASLGYCSRSQVRFLIKSGRVEVRGIENPKPELRVNASDVLMDGEELDQPEGLLILMHKPLDYVCSHSEEEGLNVYSLLPERWNLRSPKVVSVGRLDRDTSGLLLLTDQHDLVHALTSPKKHVAKIYQIQVDKKLSTDLIDTFASGKLLLADDKKPCLPATLKILDDLHAELEIFEGRYHQVRRMFAACGYGVEQLHRSQMGTLDLGELKAGEWKLLPLNSF